MLTQFYKDGSVLHCKETNLYTLYSVRQAVFMLDRVSTALCCFTLCWLDWCAYSQYTQTQKDMQGLRMYVMYVCMYVCIRAGR